MWPQITVLLISYIFINCFLTVILIHFGQNCCYNPEKVVLVFDQSIATLFCFIRNKFYSNSASYERIQKILVVGKYLSLSTLSQAQVHAANIQKLCVRVAISIYARTLFCHHPIIHLCELYGCLTSRCQHYADEPMSSG